MVRDRTSVSTNH